MPISNELQAAINDAQQALRELDNSSAGRLTKLYNDYREKIEQTVLIYANAGAGRIGSSQMIGLIRQIEARLDQLNAEIQQQLADEQQRSAQIGVTPFSATQTVPPELIAAAVTATLSNIKETVAKDGLQLSDRLWRIDAGAREVLSRTIREAVSQGESAWKTANAFVSRGEAVPASISRKANNANPEQLSKLLGKEFMTGAMNPLAQAKRVFRTEINRAHGEAFKASAFVDPDVVGTKFTLSPNHRKKDICDLHASANLHGLGTGVYPVGKSPWPAHPNTISFEQLVYRDEVSQADEAGQQTGLEWLSEQPPTTQLNVLGSQKKYKAYKIGLIKESQINKPWHKVEASLKRRGINTDLI